MHQIYLSLITIALLSFTSSAFAQSQIDSVRLSASDDLHVLVKGADVANPDSILDVLVSGVRADAGEWVSGTEGPITISARRIGQTLAIITAEDGLDLSQLYFYQPTNGIFRPLNAKPILDRQAGMLTDFDSSLAMARNDHALSDSDFVAVLLSFATNHPDQKLHNFELRMENGRVQPAKIVVAVPDLPPPLVGIKVHVTKPAVNPGPKPALSTAQTTEFNDWFEGGNP